LDKETALIQGIHIMMESQNFSCTHVCTLLRYCPLLGHSKSTSNGTVNLPALVMTSFIRPLTAPPSESGAATHSESWIIITILAFIALCRRISSSSTMAVLIKSASICWVQVTRN
jgi:hypothetical protein